jgi:hypothetical protein
MPILISLKQLEKYLKLRQKLFLYKDKKQFKYKKDWNNLEKKLLTIEKNFWILFHLLMTTNLQLIKSKNNIQ